MLRNAGFAKRTGRKLQGKTPGLIRHVLTVVVFLLWVLLLPRPPPSSWSLRLCDWASILLHGPLDVCLDLLPAAPPPPVQKRDAQHMFLQHRGARAEFSKFGGGGWADPGVLWKKAPRAMRAMRGKTLETVPFQPYFGCTKSFLKALSN